MDLDAFVKVISNLEPLFLVGSLLATVLGTAVAALAKRGAVSAFEATIESRRRKQESPPDKATPAKDIVSIRLDEVRETLKKQERIAKAYGYASAILTFGQFVVGGLLATSFLQENLSKAWVGILGLLVLVSSLVRQYYRPDVQASGARERSVRLKALIREAENQLSLLDEGGEAMSRQEILSMLTIGLSQIEEAELRDVQSSVRYIDSSASKSTKKRPPKLPRAT